VLPGIDARVDAGDLACGINQEGVARSELHHSQIRHGPVRVHHLMARVGEQFEVQALFGAERFVRVDAVAADTDDDSIVLGVLRLVHLKLVGFARSTRGLILRVKVEDYPLSAVILEADV
jgi:hypothetical protein